MKAIIPVAGSGSRLRPITCDTPKALLPVGGEPVLWHVLEKIRDLGIDEVMLVVSPSGEGIRQYVNQHGRLNVRFVVQHEPGGIGHAVYQCRAYLENEPVLIVLGDVIFLSDFSLLREESPVARIGINKVEGDLSRFGQVEVEDGVITRLVEKPENPISNLAIAGIYYIPNSSLLMRSLEHLVRRRPIAQKEIQITDALQEMADCGERITPFTVDEWYDCGTPERLLEANRRLLDLYGGSCKSPGNQIIPPVKIAAESHVEKSVVGPHVAVSPGASIIRSIVRDTIVGPGARIEYSYLNGSIVAPHDEGISKGGRSGIELVSEAYN